MYATNWTISDNVFVGIQGRTRQARGAIFLWHDSRDCTIERNIIIDCDSGICLGNSHRPPHITTHCTNCVVRNNFLTRAPENGILADYTRDCAIVHNTVHDPENRLKRLVRLVHDNDGLLVANNLLSGPPMRQDHVSGDLRIVGNVTRDLTSAFVDALTGNLHLETNVPDVVDAGASVPGVDHDIDVERRDGAPDIGADELAE
jgi:parallel beta-helix repeat protein